MRYDGTPGELVETPDEHYDGGTGTLPALRQLRALCLTGRNFTHVTVGEPFRYSTEWIRLDDSHSTTFERWQQARHRNQNFRLFCTECGRVTIHAPKGAVEVDE